MKKLIKRTLKNKHPYKKNKTYRGGFIASKQGLTILQEQSRQGISKKNTYKTLINNIILNSTKKLISYSSLYGLILKMSIVGDEYNYFVDSEGNVIKDFLIKLSFIHEGVASSSIISLEPALNSKSLPKKNTVSIDEFQAEHKIQKDIFKQSIGAFGKAIVPDIQFFETYLELIDDPRNAYLFTFIPEDDAILNAYFADAIAKNVKKIGVFIMKYADNYDTLDNVYTKYYNEKNNDKLNELVLIYRIHHILLGLLGYVHSDAHSANIMINKTDIYAGLIIDFGRIKKINFDCLGLVKNFSLKTDIDDITLIRYITTIIHYISNYCDSVRRDMQLDIKDWECMNIGHWDKVNGLSLLHIVGKLKEYFEAFKLNNMPNIPYIKEIVRLTYT